MDNFIFSTVSDSIAGNVSGLAKVWTSVLVCPLMIKIKKRKYTFKRNHSEGTKSVAKNLSGLENVQPITEVE